MAAPRTSEKSGARYNNRPGWVVVREEGKGGVDTWVKPRHYQTAGGRGLAGCDQEKRGTGGGGEKRGGVRVMIPRRMRLIEWVDSSGGAGVEGAVALVCGSYSCR